ncbi:MAG: SGNH/GDSL hydrolase family protein, partial [Phycisphaerae bacterium]|nr:SGNH/GDSL hydrolase family protein [Phycisphaerae bacterium]
MIRQILLSVLALGCIACSTAPVGAAEKYKTIETARNGMQKLYGLVNPLDQEGKNFYILNSDGLIEVKLADGAKIGLLFRERNIKKMLEDRKIRIGGVNRQYDLPKKLYVKIVFPNWRSAQGVLKSGEFRDGMLHADTLKDHLPTEKEPWLCGELTGLEDGHITPKKVVTASDKTFKGSTNGFNYSEQIVGLMDHTAIKPFCNQASVYGTLKGDVFYASHVLLRPIPDQAAKDDPKLPRYLFIGDSISGNYGKGLRAALKGKYNIHHPATNCGPSGKGRSMVKAWLGAYKNSKRHWDVISFNFGHWDAGNSKKKYQENMESVIQQLKPTGAKLIWITTCPVPKGYKPAGALVDKGSKGICAPGRTSGVMNKYLNPWALEVVKRHPEIT